MFVYNKAEEDKIREFGTTKKLAKELDEKMNLIKTHFILWMALLMRVVTFT
jgi:hypothetical protein